MPLRLLIAPLLALAVTIGAGPATLHAGGGPENLALVVNADSWASVAVANEYIRLRGVPAQNVVYMSGLPSYETVSVDYFRRRILGPVLQLLQLRGLAPQIDYLVYSSDLPYAVDVRKDIGDQKFPKIITPTASINGLTYLYPLTMTKNTGYLGLSSNFYMRQLIRPVEPVAWTKEHSSLYSDTIKQMADGKYADALPALLRLERDYPKASTLHYNLACCLAKLKRPEEAVGYLQRAFETGWLDVEHTMRDEDLESLRERADYRALVTEMAKKTYQVQDSRGFRGMYGWSRQGQPVQPDRGIRYLLSTMLAVTSGRGTSVSEAIGYLGRSAAADGKRPSGDIYYMTNGNVRAKTRQWGFKSAITELEKLGVKALIREGVLPEQASRVMGAQVGAANFNWKASGSNVLPGAICEHLTSLGGVMRQNGGQTPLSAFLKAGAAGASGTVTEPYAIQAKFPTPFIHVHYARGCSLAEAFYQSVAGPYQLLIVGDPLCAPWARQPKVQVEGVEPGQTVKGRITLRPSVQDAEATPVRRFELYVNGRRVGACGPEGKFDLETKGLADGYHELRVVGLAADAIETQGRVVLPITVDNHGRVVTLEADRDTVTLDGAVTLSAAMPGAAEIHITHNARRLARIEGEKGKVSIDASRLGMGVAAVHAVAVLPGEEDGKKTIVTAQPTVVTVRRPESLPSLRGVKFDTLKPGLRVTVAGGQPAVVTDLRNPNWLGTQAGVKVGKAFVAEASFVAGAEDVYQFQIRTDAKVGVEVDGRKIGQVEGETWHFFPVTLKPGVHRLRLIGEGGKSGRLDVRFGGSGTRTLDSERFRH